MWKYRLNYSQIVLAYGGIFLLTNYLSFTEAHLFFWPWVYAPLPAIQFHLSSAALATSFAVCYQYCDTTCKCNPHIVVNWQLARSHISPIPCFTVNTNVSATSYILQLLFCFGTKPEAEPKPKPKPEPASVVLALAKLHSPRHWVQAQHYSRAASILHPAGVSSFCLIVALFVAFIKLISIHFTSFLTHLSMICLLACLSAWSGLKLDNLWGWHAEEISVFSVSVFIFFFLASYDFNQLSSLDRSGPIKS